MRGDALRARCTRYIDQLVSVSGIDPVVLSHFRTLVRSSKSSAVTAGLLWHDNVKLRKELVLVSAEYIRTSELLRRLEAQICAAPAQQV